MLVKQGLRLKRDGQVLLVDTALVLIFPVYAVFDHV
jgi:hypothetical protein